MCIYANAFVAGKNRDSLLLPKSPPGLQVAFDGELQPVFIDGFKDIEGVFLVFHDGHCLCQYKDWNTFFDYIERIRQGNDVDRVPVMVFGTGVEYSAIKKIDVDLELDDLTNRPKEGDILFVGISVGRRLAKSVGSQIGLLFKDGKTMTGTLRAYQSEQEYGELEIDGNTIYFNANEIRHIDRLV